MIRIAVENPGQPDIVALLEASDAHVASLYPAASNHMLDVEELRRPEVTFIVARDPADYRALGCGALVNSANGWAEIKRLFVSPAARGQKLGRRLLQELEALAARDGIASLRLETGVKQTPALALYASAGFAPIGPFGDYRADPFSVFMEKRVDAQR